jgi:hypothetical protein
MRRGWYDNADRHGGVPVTALNVGDRVTVRIGFNDEPGRVTKLRSRNRVVVACDNGNMTSNVAPMWRLAGADLAEFHGQYAGNVLHLLDKAIADMAANPDKYTPLNPSNGWGDYDGCLAFLRELRAEFVRHPQAKVQVSR